MQIDDLANLFSNLSLQHRGPPRVDFAPSDGPSDISFFTFDLESVLRVNIGPVRPLTLPTMSEIWSWHRRVPDQSSLDDGNATDDDAEDDDVPTHRGKRAKRGN